MQLATPQPLSPTTVHNTSRAQSRKQVLAIIAEKAAACCAVPEQAIFQALLERERLGSTGVGKGVAIPHARFAEIKEPISVFVRVPDAVDFDAPDGRKVDLFYALLVPKSADKTVHLRHMARIARLMRREELCTSIRQAPNDDVIDALLADAEKG